MTVIGLKCITCGNSYPLADKYECDSCHGILSVDYKIENDKEQNFEAFLEPNLPGIWRYKNFLPLQDVKNIISLGEGLTSTVVTSNLYRDIGIKDLYIKAEFTNPTGSFKDRPTSVAISVAKELGMHTVAVASSGNASASVAAYAAKAKMNSLICVPCDTPQEKVAQLLAYGARVFYVEGAYSNSFSAMQDACKRYGYANLTSTYINPYTVEGDKTVAYELYEQIKDVPDYIVVPIGAGPLLCGIWRGYCELKSLGFIQKLPKMIGVQAENCSPIYKSFIRNDGTFEAATDYKKTVAGGISDQLIGYEKDGEYTVRLIKESQGLALTLTEEEILTAWQDICKQEGLFVEPTAACSVGAVKKLVESNLISPQCSIVAIATGHGLKSLGQLSGGLTSINVITSGKDITL